MKAATIVEPGKVVIEEKEKPHPEADEVLIRVEASGIWGTDLHIFRGEYLGTYPIIPGHEGAGRIEEIGEKVQRFRKGDPVAFEPNLACDNCENCLNNRQNFCSNWDAIGVTLPGCMAEYVKVPEKNVFLTGGLDPEAAAFMEPLSCVLHGMQKTGIRPGDDVLILGAGPIGLQLLQVASSLGAAGLTVVERIGTRAELTLELGAGRVESDIGVLPKDAYDLVIDATGAIPLIESALDHVRYGGTVLLFGVAPQGKTMNIEHFRIFRKGLKIVSSYTSLRNSFQAVETIRSGRVDVRRLVSHRFSLDDFEQGLRLLGSGEDGVKKVLVMPGMNK